MRTWTSSFLSIQNVSLASFKYSWHPIEVLVDILLIGFFFNVFFSLLGQAFYLGNSIEEFVLRSWEQSYSAWIWKSSLSWRPGTLWFLRRCRSSQLHGWLTRASRWVLIPGSSILIVRHWVQSSLGASEVIQWLRFLKGCLLIALSEVIVLTEHVFFEVDTFNPFTAVDLASTWVFHRCKHFF